MSNNDELTEARFWEIMSNIPEPPQVFFRLYHDAEGRPLFYSMEDIPGTYITITHAEYAASNPNVRVRDGKLIPITWVTTTVLEPSETGTPCHPNNVAIVVSPNREHQCWSKQTYEQN